MSDDFLNIDRKKTKDRIIEFIRQNVIESDRQGALVGVSGGLDSALVLKLCILALGSKNVCAVILPERDSDPVNIKDAIRFAKGQDVRVIKKKITPIIAFIGAYRSYPPTFLIKKQAIKRYIHKKREELSQLLEKDLYIANLEGAANKELNRAISFARIKNRTRAAILYYYAELNNYLYVGCTNKSEHLSGFFVKYGDGIADIMPLVSLYKTQVYALGHFLGIPDHILNKKPSPDLIPTLVDEDLLGISYKKLDLILYGIEKGMSFDEMISSFQVTELGIEKVFEIINKSEKMRAGPAFLNIRNF